MTLTAESNHHYLGQTPASVHNVRDRRKSSSYDGDELAGPRDGSDHEARNRLVQANLGLVVTIARQFLRRGLELDDLIGEGNLGLIRAAEDFDPRFGTRFSSYAAHWIKEAIRSALKNTTATIRLPVHMVGRLTKWRRAERTLLRETGRAPTFEEIASVLRLSEVQKCMVAQALQAGQLKLEGSCSDGPFNLLADTVQDWRTSSEDVIESADEWRMTERRMERLESRERAILALRFGLEGEALTLNEIGRRFGLTREWIRKLELRSVHKLGEDRSECASASQEVSQSQVRRRGRNVGPAKAMSTKSLRRNDSSGGSTRYRRRPDYQSA
jgi:RNA polymerase primary sigma factor